MAKQKQTTPTIDDKAAAAAAVLVTDQNVTVEHHATCGDDVQYQVMFNGVRVAYVLAAENARINFLPQGNSSKLWLTPAEQIAICKIVREKMAAVVTQAADEQLELARLIEGEPLPE